MNEDRKKELEDAKHVRKKISVIVKVILLLGPLIFSVISMFHVIEFLSLGQNKWMSVTVGIAYEIVNIAILAAIIAVPKYSKGLIWIIFTIIMLVQIAGNMYFVFDFIQKAIATDEDWVKNVILLVRQMITVRNTDTIVFIITIIIGPVIPVISLLLIKATSSYLELPDDAELEELEEEIKTEPITDDIKKLKGEFDKNKKSTDEVKDIVDELKEVHDHSLKIRVE